MKTTRNILLMALTSLAIVTVWAEDSAAVKDMANLQGEWTMVSGERDGHAFPKAMQETFKRVAIGDETTVTAGDELMLKAKFTLDPSKQPKAIDYSVIGGSYTGTHQLGIYELDGDTVKFCFSVAGKPRPADFSTKLDDGRTLTVWKLLHK